LDSGHNRTASPSPSTDTTDSIRTNYNNHTKNDDPIYTFIIHKTGFDSLPPTTKKGPSFAAFDHGDHVHIIFSVAYTNNTSRQVTSILKFLGATLEGTTEAHTSLQLVRFHTRFISYLIRKGLSTFHKYGNKLISILKPTDSTTDQSDRPHKKLKSSATGIVGQTTHNVEQDGYGKHMHPTTSTIPIPIKTSHVHGELKRSMWLNLQFCDTDVCGYFMPYHLLQFWTGLDPQENNTLQTFNNLIPSSYGITWHEFQLNIYNQATTRKRLLTQGSTTYETIDFETSQNLMILTDINNTHQPSVLWPDEYMPPGHKNTTDNLQLGTNYCKIEELATGHTKTFHFTPERLPSSHVWEPTFIDKSGDHANKLFPARQHTTGVQAQDIPLIATSTTSFTSMHIQWQPSSLPFIQLESPKILSENGNMKFIYRTRWDFSVPYTLHIKPSSATETSYNKYVIPYPKAKEVSTKSTKSYTFLTTPTLL
jgi:hypothetical protein